MTQELTVKDAMHLYPILQGLAKYDQTDSGDYQADESTPPYKISPNDMDSYVELHNIISTPSKFFPTFRFPFAVTFNGRKLNPLEMAELYRQLARYDNSDGAFDGSISPTLMEQKLYIPSSATSAVFLGNEWSPAKRLSVYSAFYADMITMLAEKYKDSNFPLGRAYANGLANSPSNSFRLRRPYSGEKAYIKMLSNKIRDGGKHEQYANLLIEALPKIRVLEAYIMDVEEQAELEPEPFGLTPLFNEEDIGVYLITYPQFGQDTIDAKRTCTQLPTKKGWKYKCLPRVGSHSREKVEEILQAYINRAQLRDWKNIRLYLEMGRVRSIFRYMQDIPPKSAIHQMIIHESLHYRNLTRPPEWNGFSLSQFVNLLNELHDGKLTSYNDRHMLGYYLTFIQRMAFEEGESIRQNMHAHSQFISQLSRLANEAEENLTDTEAWAVYYGEERMKELKLQPWIFGKEEKGEKGLIFNDNEIEILKRQL